MAEQEQERRILESFEVDDVEGVFRTATSAIVERCKNGTSLLQAHKEVTEYLHSVFAKSMDEDQADVITRALLMQAVFVGFASLCRAPMARPGAPVEPVGPEAPPEREMTMIQVDPGWRVRDPRPGRPENLRSLNLEHQSGWGQGRNVHLLDEEYGLDLVQCLLGLVYSLPRGRGSFEEVTRLLHRDAFALLCSKLPAEADRPRMQDVFVTTLNAMFLGIAQDVIEVDRKEIAPGGGWLTNVTLSDAVAEIVRADPNAYAEVRGLRNLRDMVAGVPTGRLLTRRGITAALNGKTGWLFWPADGRWHPVEISDVKVDGVEKTATATYTETTETEILKLAEIARDAELVLRDVGAVGATAAEPEAAAAAAAPAAAGEEGEEMEN